MQSREVIANVGLGLIGGFVGTKVMEPVSMKLYEWEPEEARRQEDAVRPGPPYELAARKITTLLGLTLSDQKIQTVGTILFHYGLGMSWGPVYTLLRRRTDLNPVAAGLGTGLAMSLIVDEGLTPLLGFSAPNRAYPLVTHVRGVVAHLAWGLGVAAAAEALVWLGRHAGAQRG